MIYSGVLSVVTGRMKTESEKWGKGHEGVSQFKTEMTDPGMYRKHHAR